MEPYKPLSFCALLDGVSELERFFDSYKQEIIASIRGTADPRFPITSTAASNNNNYSVPPSALGYYYGANGMNTYPTGNPTNLQQSSNMFLGSPQRQQQNQENTRNGNNNEKRSPSPFSRGPLARAADLEENNNNNEDSASGGNQNVNNNSTTSLPTFIPVAMNDSTTNKDIVFNNNNNNNNNNSINGVANGGASITSRVMYQTQVENEVLSRKMFGADHGVLDLVHHLFTRHGTSHELFDAVEHLNLLIPNWHDPRKNDDGSLFETPEMRMYAMKTYSSQNNNNNNNQENTEKNSSSSSLWRKNYAVSDICQLTGLTNDPAVVRLLERDRGFGTKLWKVQQPLNQDGAPPLEIRPGFGEPEKKKSHGWRSRLKFAASLRAIQDRAFVSPDAREAIRHLEQLDLPNCSFEPHDLVAMSNALTTKLELSAERATRDEMIADLRQQVRAIESFVRSLEKDQEQFSEDGEMALLKSSAIQQIEWYERLLRAMESQFDVACDDIESAEQARKQRNWSIFRQAKGDLPCVDGKVRARIGRLESAAGKIRDFMRERAFVYEGDLHKLDQEIAGSTNNCTNHLQDLTECFDELVECIKKAAQVEKKFREKGAALRATVVDRLDLIGARCLKDNAHTSLLKASNDVLLDLAEEMERLNNSKHFLSELHAVVCSGSNNITEQYDRRREELLTQAEQIHDEHEKWLHEYSVALGRHRHRVSSALTDAKEHEKRSEMRRELAADLLDFQARAYAQTRDEAATDKVRIKTELAALDGSFHARNEEFKKRAVLLNHTKEFVEELIRQGYERNNNNNNNGSTLVPKQQQQEKKFTRPRDPMTEQTAIDLINLTSQHHLEKNLRNRYEVVGHSKEAQAMRQVMWEKDSIEQAKEASRVARRIPLPTTSVASSPPPFLSPAPPKLPSSSSSYSSSYFANNHNNYDVLSTNILASSRPRTAQLAPRISTTTTTMTMNPQNQNEKNNNIRPSSASNTVNAMRTRLGNKVTSGQVMKVVYPFHPRVDDELRLERGDTVIILRQGEDAGWAFGVSHDKMGQFPLNYVEPVPY